MRKSLILAFLLVVYLGPTEAQVSGGLPPLDRPPAPKKHGAQKAKVPPVEDNSEGRRQKGQETEPATSSSAGPAAESRSVESPRQEEDRPSASRRPNLSELSDSERTSIESVCSGAKYREGPVAYNAALSNKIDELQRTGSRRPNLSGLSDSERTSIESVCSGAKYREGPAAYNECIYRRLSDLRSQ